MEQINPNFIGKKFFILFSKSHSTLFVHVKVIFGYLKTKFAEAQSVDFQSIVRSLLKLSRSVQIILQKKSELGEPKPLKLKV